MEVGFLYWFELDMSNTLGKKLPRQPSPPARALPARSRALPFPPGPGGALGPVNAPQLHAASGGRGRLGMETPTPLSLYAGVRETGFNLLLGGHRRPGLCVCSPVNLF